eukprot:812400-Prymnesium_polylepis.1
MLRVPRAHYNVATRSPLEVLRVVQRPDAELERLICELPRYLERFPSIPLTAACLVRKEELRRRLEIAGLRRHGREPAGLGVDVAPPLVAKLRCGSSAGVAAWLVTLVMRRAGQASVCRRPAVPLVPREERRALEPSAATVAPGERSTGRASMHGQLSSAGASFACDEPRHASVSATES